MTNEEIREGNLQKAIDAGIQCFIQDGIANTQILSVVAKAGISKRSFLRYFGSKDRFVTAVLKSVNIACFNRGRACYQRITEKYPVARERLRALFEVTGEYFLAHPDIFILLSEGQAYLAHSAEKETLISEYGLVRDYWPGIVLSLMEQGAADGSITCFAKDYIQKNESNAVWYAFTGLLVQLAYANALGNDPMENCAEIIKRFILQTVQSLH